ncbi:hypothetical protein RB614_37675 [Phytohabitans sp. ZYX-F-186]|uniref:DUF2399 domain-containing protein n=1 Tax=Phytohabitans maris TaxID=3071409 RepID=A0ABU0ZV83_9ACTN|nr:hypothetical protein [Phytohabitans sp. ZYX-F-186]MDQ7910239.1 hypothetical protein [Phytohabitans sp. ZYX-F-186]
MTTTVSGRTYKRTRPRGFAEWAPRPDTLVLLDQINAVLAEYDRHLPMTARQLFYRLVGSAGYSKTEQAYERLCELLNRARRARRIPMSAIRDDGTTVKATWGYDSPADFWTTVRGSAGAYKHEPTDGQRITVELWVEAAGMVPMVARIAHQYGVNVYSSGGFDSVTAKYEAARRMANRDTPTAVLHIGDHDPSGLSILDSVAEDVTAFFRDIEPGDIAPTFVRVAVTPEQTERYALETAPQKTTDRRGEAMADTVQAEALSPDELERELRDALETWVDMEALTAAKAKTQAERAEILATLDELGAGR